VRELQRVLARGTNGPGVLLWPYHDLAPEHPAFEAAGLMTLAGIWRADADSVFFLPDKGISAEEWEATVARAPIAAHDALRKQAPPATRSAAVRVLASAIAFEQLPFTE
jgi:hypothetical protein